MCQAVGPWVITIGNVSSLGHGDGTNLAMWGRGREGLSL